MIKLIGSITIATCALYGLYNIGVSYDVALKSKGPEYTKALMKLEATDCKYEYQQTNAEYGANEQLNGTQLVDLIEKVALQSCGVKQNHQVQDTALEALKFLHLKGKSGVVMTAIDSLMEEKGDRCEKSVQLIKQICPTALKRAGYKGRTQIIRALR